jgi:mRNA interferase HigB
MKVLGRQILNNFSRKHADAKKALNVWVNEVEAASWQTSQDIKNRYSSASFVESNRVIFNIRGNNYRLVVKVRYEEGIVLIEGVGTHAEYDKKRF